MKISGYEIIRKCRFQPLTIVTKRFILDVAAALDPPLISIFKIFFHFKQITLTGSNHLEGYIRSWSYCYSELILKLVSATFYQCFLFHLKSSFRSRDIQISIFSPSSPCQPLLESLIEDRSYSLWRHQLFKLKLSNTFCLISWEGKKAWHWNFGHWCSIK